MAQCKTKFRFDCSDSWYSPLNKCKHRACGVSLVSPSSQQLRNAFHKDAWNWTWQKYSCCRLFQSIADFRDHFYAMFPKKNYICQRLSSGSNSPMVTPRCSQKRQNCLSPSKEWKVERNSCFSFELIAEFWQKFKLQSFGQQKQIPQGATSLLFRLSPSSSLLSAKRGPFRRPAVRAGKKDPKTSWPWW